MAVAKQGILQKRIKKPSVANTVMQRVYDALLEGEIKPGDLLPSEAELSEQCRARVRLFVPALMKQPLIP